MLVDHLTEKLVNVLEKFFSDHNTRSYPQQESRTASRNRSYSVPSYPDAKRVHGELLQAGRKLNRAVVS